MTPEQKHNEIREKIIAAVPEIVRDLYAEELLKEISTASGERHRHLWDEIEKRQYMSQSRSGPIAQARRDGYDFGIGLAIEILNKRIIGDGREIRLPDVLLAMEQLLKDEELILGAQGVLALCKSPVVEVRWNLRKDSLADNPQCWDLLHGILCV